MFTRRGGGSVATVRLATRAVAATPVLPLALQGGEGGPASGVHRDWVKQLLPATLNRLAEVVADDPAKRPLLLKVIEVPITAEPNGVWKGAINMDTFRQILFSALKYSSCFDKTAVEEAAQPLELLYKEDWKRVANTARYLNPAYGYYSLRGPTLIARPPTSPAFSGVLLLYDPAIPDFNTVPLPYELVEDAQVILWGMARQFFNLRK